MTSVSTTIQTQRQQFPENIAYLKSLTTKEKRENYLKFVELKIQELQKRDQRSAAISVRRNQNCHPKCPRKNRFVRTLEKVDELWRATLNLKQVKTVVKAKEDLSHKSSRESHGGFQQRVHVKKATRSVNEVVQLCSPKLRARRRRKKAASKRWTKWEAQIFLSIFPIRYEYFFLFF